jgi:hypothetical protein
MDECGNIGLERKLNMKIVIKALIGSFVIHFIYMVGRMTVSYVKTKNYNPDIASAWNKVETLQSEVVFGQVGSPFLYLFSFLGVTVICGIIMFSYKKWVN